MKKFLVLCIFSAILLFTSCARLTYQTDLCEKSIVADPQYDFNDLIEGLGWEEGSTLRLEIDDPANGSGVDYSDEKKVEKGENDDFSVVSFLTGEKWDLVPGHIISLSDGETTIQHIVQDFQVDDIDINTDTFLGGARPGSEIMVWVEAPYRHEMTVTTKTDGSWSADLSGLTDIIPSSSGAIAQYDESGGCSHTRINWDFDRFHIEASLVDDQIIFFDTVPFRETTFQIFQTKGGKLLYEGSQTSDEIGNVWFMNENRDIDLVPGIFITGRDETTGVEASLELANLKMTGVDLNLNSISGIADPGGTVIVYAYDLLSEDEFVIEVETDPQGDWTAQFDVNLHSDMEFYARVFDMEQDETSVRWIPDK